MGLINKIKEYRRTRMFEKCFSKQKWVGNTFMNFCEGKDAVEWGFLDGFELYCLNCPHLPVELKAEMYKEGLLKRRKQNEFMAKYLCEPVQPRVSHGPWHSCSYKHGELIYDGSWEDGKWYEWKDIFGNVEEARMKLDTPDHFFPPTDVIKEEDVVAYREVRYGD